MFLSWLVVTGILIDFILLVFWFRSMDQSWGGRWVVSCAVMFLVWFATVTVILSWVCRHYQISTAAFGIRPSIMFSDFRWSFRICVFGASVIAAALVFSLVSVLGLGIRLPASPESYVQFLGGNWCVQYSIFMVGISVTGNMLVVVTEELIYRSLFLFPLTSRLGFYSAVVVISIVFGMAHVIFSGHVWIPVFEIIGGMLMVAGFAIWWSVVLVMIIHAMGNLFVGALIFIYVQLFMVCPTLFFGQQRRVVASWS